MAADSPEQISKALKLIYKVGIALGILTVLTWALAFGDIGAPGIDSADLILGLAVASVKASLVALIFMHLNHENKLIYKILVFTIVFALGMFVLSFLHWMDPAVFDDFFTSK